MDGEFLARLAIAFVVGGGTVALFTLVAERFGSRVGGLILSLPVKVAITLVLVALTEGADVAAAAAAAAPAGLAANVAFLGAAVLALARGAPLAAAIAAGLAAWLAGAAALVALLPSGVAWSAAAFAAAAVPTFMLLSRGRRAGVLRAKKPRPGAWGVLGRAAFAGSIVAAAVVATRVAGPEVGGVLSVFPSGLLTSVVILQRAQGSAFTAETVRTMVAGLAAPTLYLAVISVLYPVAHVALATAAAVAVAAATSTAVGAALARADGREGRRTPPERAPEGRGR